MAGSRRERCIKRRQQQPATLRQLKVGGDIDGETMEVRELKIRVAKINVSVSESIDQ
ncbi:MAG: hypothetical protein AAAC47_10280 [Pararhizobium sp.]